MVLPKKKYLCPYCFERRNLADTPFRCKNDARKCPPVQDPELAFFLGAPHKMMGLFFNPPPPKGRLARLARGLKLPREATCPNCGETSNARLCVACHSELPYTIGDYRDLIFGILGAKESGKSHYISVLIHTIKNEIGANFNCSLLAMNDETMTRYRDDFYNPVFREKRVIRLTRSARADRRVRIPLIYSLSFVCKNLYGKDRISDVATISFFDTAGEDLNSEEVMRTENRYIYNSSGLILLLDPLQLPVVRDALKDRAPLPKRNTENEDILERTARLIRRAKKIKSKQLIDIPIAVAFSKFDAVDSLLSPESNLRYPSKHQAVFDIGDFESVNSEMEALVAEWSRGELIRQLKTHFKHYAYFGLTALGCNPHGDQHISAVRPVRVADPFLWLMWRNKLIPSKERGS